MLTFSSFIKPPFSFFIKAAALFLLYFFIYELWLLPQGKVDYLLINHLINATKNLLEFMGFTTFATNNFVGIDGTHGINIGPPCNGIKLAVLFTGFIIAFPGSLKHKLWFIPSGIILIHLLNILRLAILAIVVLYKPEALNFHHTYTFTIAIYSIIFIFWMLWIRFFSVEKA